ncbi:hypothetical protein Tco_1100380 [Tanacetum coccineum]
MVLMVERNYGEHLIHRFAGRGNQPDPRDVKIASLKQQIQELERRQEKTRSKRAWETLNGENPFSYVCDRGNNRGDVRKKTLYRLGLQVEITECIVDKAPYYPGFHGEHHDNPLLTKETESERIILWDIGDEEEDYPFVNKYLSFQEEPIMLVEEELCLVYDTDNEEDAEPAPKYDFDGVEDEVVYADYEEASIFDDDRYEEEIVSGDVGKGLVDNYPNFQEDENNMSFLGVVLGVKEESMPVYDTDIEDVIVEEKDSIKDVVVVANDLCSSMIQTTSSVDFSKTVDSNPHGLTWLWSRSIDPIVLLIHEGGGDVVVVVMVVTVTGGCVSMLVGVGDEDEDV